MRAFRSEGKLFYIITALLCVAAIVAVNIIFRTKKPAPTPEESSNIRTSVILTEPPVQTTVQTTERTETVQTTAAPETAAPTEYVTEPAPEPEPEPEPVVPVYTPPSTEYIPPDGRSTDLSGSLFIGDSRTEGFMLYSGVTGAKAYTVRGLMVDTFFTSPSVNRNGQKITVADALADDSGYSKIFITLGINELGWVYDSVFHDCYAKLINYVRETCPSSEIYVQTLIPVTATKSASDDIFNNQNIARYNDIIRSLASECGVGLIDAAAEICPEGVLPEDGAFDGIHLKKPYCQRWLDVIKGDVG